MLFADDNGDQFDSGKMPEDIIPKGSLDFSVYGQRKDQNTIFLKLRIADSSGYLLVYFFYYRQFLFLEKKNLLKSMIIILCDFLMSSGRIRNIHFPFDIEVDTSTAVASEMVEELDLTDHDVSIIVDMIDSEIRSHIPDWEPVEIYGNIISGEAISTSSRSGGQDDASHTEIDSAHSGSSPMTNHSARTGPLVLERLPSGRRFWSDSPKTSVATSPLRPIPSKADSVASGDSWSEENSPSSIFHKDVNRSLDASPLRHVENEFDHDICTEVDGPHAFEENTIPSETKSNDIKLTVKKLEHLLDKQRRELDELKQSHELAVSDLLNELPPEMRHKF